MHRNAAYFDTQSSNAVNLRLTQLAQLSPQETDILQDLSHSARHYPAYTELCPEGCVQSPLMLLSGWACISTP